MKKFLLLLLIIPFITAASWNTKAITKFNGATVTKVCNGNVTLTSTPSYCSGTATCTDTTPGQCDVLCEDFEGASNCDSDDNPDLDANCRGSLVFAVGTNATWDTATTHSGTFSCNDKGSYALQLTRTTDSSTNYALFTADADKDDSFVQFYWNPVNTTIGSGNLVGIAGAETAASQAAWKLNLTNSGGTLRLSVQYYNSSNSTATTTGSTTAIPDDANTWYRMRIVTDTSGGLITVYINDTEEIAITNFNTGRVPRRFFLSTNANNTAAATFQWDNWAIDDDMGQGACN